MMIPQAFVGITIKNSEHLKELIIALHNDGLSVMDIAYHLPCSHQYISQILISASKSLTKLLK